MPFGLNVGIGAPDDDVPFDPPDAFVPENVPGPGPYLEGGRILADEDHVAVHATASELFEERGVYDVTFGYNLARLNRDPRHPDAGFRYAVLDGDPDDVPGDAADPAILVAEFTPTSSFCPQADALTRAAFRAWNGLLDRHEFDLVRVRVDPLHRDFGAINDRLSDLEAEFVATGEVPDPERDELDA